MFAKRLFISVVCANLALTPSVGVWAASDLATESLNLNLPSMGAVAGTELSPAEEQVLGEEMMRQIRADSSYLNDAETLEYLNRLGYSYLQLFLLPLSRSFFKRFCYPGRLYCRSYRLNYCCPK